MTEMCIFLEQVFLNRETSDSFLGSEKCQNQNVILY